MRKLMLLAGTACFISASANALEFNPYISAKMSYSDMNNSLHIGEEINNAVEYSKGRLDDHPWGGHFAAGVQSGNVRAEAEINLYRKGKYKIADEEGASKFTIARNSVMFNAYYDFRNQTAFTPYVGAGLGWSHLKMRVKDTEGKDDRSSNHFAWQVGAGVAFAATENLSLDLGYRYMDSGSLTFRDREEWPEGNSLSKSRISSYSHEIMLGLRYTF